jgi:hypothetical protein
MGSSAHGTWRLPVTEVTRLRHLGEEEAEEDVEVNNGATARPLRAVSGGRSLFGENRDTARGYYTRILCTDNINY